MHDVYLIAVTGFSGVAIKTVSSAKVAVDVLLSNGISVVNSV